MERWGVDISILHTCILMQEQHALEQYYYFAIYRKQIPAVWLAKE